MSPSVTSGSTTAATIQPTGPSAARPKITSGTPITSATTIATTAGNPIARGYVGPIAGTMPSPMGGRLAIRAVAGSALAAFAIGLFLAVDRGLEEENELPPATIATAPQPKPKPKPTIRRPTPARLVPLVAAGAFDPEGDGRERDEETRFAVDGRADTSWRTERYSSFSKTGVGLVLDARRRVRVEQVVVDTPTAGFRAEIRLGDDREGPFTRVSPARRMTSRTRFPVARRAGRYVVLWVVELPPDGAGVVSEVRLRARG